MDREHRTPEGRRRPHPTGKPSPGQERRRKPRPNERAAARPEPKAAPAEGEAPRRATPFQGGRKESRGRERERQNKRMKQRRKARQAKRQREQDRRDPVKPLNRRNLVIKLVAMLGVVLALTLGLTIFFKIQVIQVTGNEKYTAQEIVEASGVELGENLLAFGKSGAAGRILTELPYVGTVQIGIKLPNTVNIDIVELSASFVLEDTEGQWWLTDGSGKILEQADAQSLSGYIQVKGIRILPTKVGRTMEVAEDPQTGEEPEDFLQEQTGNAAERGDAALKIMETLAKRDRSGRITIVDVTRLYDIQVWYGETYQVLLSGPADLSYKVRYMVDAVEYLTAEGYYGGILDLSARETGKAVFTPW